MNSKPLFASAAAIALLYPSVSTAQESNSDQDGLLLGSVTVTATKQQDAENVQDIPVAVTAFNEATLDALKVRDIESLSFSSPNVSLDDIGTSKGVANFSVRGLGINSSIPSIDPTVGVFVDGVYIGINNGVIQDTFDLDSIEILRGPQGLLAGRNTTGGAVYINTGNPTDEFEFKMRVAVDGPIDDGRGGLNKMVQGVISGPLIANKLNGRLSALYNTDDGYFENQFDGSNLGAFDTFVLRGSLELNPSEQLSVLGKLEWVDVDGDGAAGQNRGLFDRNSFDISIDNPGLFTSEAIRGSVRADLDVDFGDGTITNIFGVRDFEQQTAGDIDALPVFIFHSESDLRQDQISNELRYAGRFGSAGLTTGLYYFQQDIAYDEFRFLPPVTALPFAGGGRQEHTVYGLFAQIDFDVSDALTLTGGLRYSQEEKEVEITYTIPRLSSCSVVSRTCPQDVEDDDSWSNLTPKIGVQYFFDDNVQAYGTYTKGFRSGGYNIRIVNPAVFQAQAAASGSISFDEEEVDAFEIGMKFQSDNRRAVLNAAAFVNEISDMQREVNVADPIAGAAQFILNTADATISGLELEGRYQISDDFVITANLGVIDAKYDNVRADLDGNGIVDGQDKSLRLPRVPDTTGGFGMIWQPSLGSLGELSARLNYQYRDSFAYTDNNLGWINQAEILDLSVDWMTPISGLTASLYGHNLLDEVTAGGDSQLPFGGPRSTGTRQPFSDNPASGTFSPLKPGRRLGVELTYTY